MDHLDYNPHPRILGGRVEELSDLAGEEEQPPRLNPQRAWIHDYSAILYLMYTATLVTIYLPIISLLQLKFQNQQNSPFETSGLFMNLSVLALCIATATSGVLFYINHRLQNSTMEDFSLVHYMILKGVFSFFGILTPVSLVLVLIIPNKLDWIRYVIICVLLGVVAISNFRAFQKLNDMEDELNMDGLEAHQMV
ncbi:unnamed protein product [Lactuca virosa]|uniref:Uncharacterized protein n=1 Tax=Lactuca virosa TaxID=75947 RepID=A0AAU9N2C1_9ASTR|nr:unnamed protein product [Lactuca virosa]